MPQIYKKVKRIRHAHEKRGSQKRTLTGRRPLFRVSEIKKGGRHAHEKRGSQKRTSFFVGVDGFEPPTLCL